MKKSASALRFLALCGPLVLALLVSCSALGLNKEHLQECQCGTEDADVLGCTAECSLPSVTCDNPLCTCEHEDDTTSKPSSAKE